MMRILGVEPTRAWFQSLSQRGMADDHLLILTETPPGFLLLDHYLDAELKAYHLDKTWVYRRRKVSVDSTGGDSKPRDDHSTRIA